MGIRDKFKKRGKKIKTVINKVDDKIDKGRDIAADKAKQAAKEAQELQRKLEADRKAAQRKLADNAARLEREAKAAKDATARLAREKAAKLEREARARKDKAKQIANEKAAHVQAQAKAKAEKIAREKERLKKRAEAAAKRKAEAAKLAAERAARAAANAAREKADAAKRAAKQKKDDALKRMQNAQAAVNNSTQNMRDRTDGIIPPWIEGPVGNLKDRVKDDIKEDLEKFRDLRESGKKHRQQWWADRKEKASDNFGVSFKRLSVRIFPTQSLDFTFPEAGEPQIKARDDLGLAVSGGGTRSMSHSLGYFRALRDMGIMDKIRYIGAISGGSWISTPYCYLPHNISDHEYLGDDVETRQLKPEFIRNDDESAILPRQIARSEILRSVGVNLLTSIVGRSLSLPTIPFLGIQFSLDDVTEIWNRIISELYLDDIGLGGDQYACWTDKQVKGILKRNQNIFGKSKLERNDFVTYTRDRPYLCINGAMNQDSYLIRDDRDEKFRPLGLRSWEHYEFTPYYSGIHRHSRGKGKLNVGGGYKENIGMDTLGGLATPQSVKVSPGRVNHRFSLQDIMGISGAAPAYILQNITRFAGKQNLANTLRNEWGGITALDGSFDNNRGVMKIFPKMRDWPVQYFAKPVTVERFFGDGGYVDNYGIIPLLKRKVRKIIVLINTDIAIDGTLDQMMKGEGVDSFILTLFGQATGRKPTLTSPSNQLQPGRFFGRENGQVFDNAQLKSTLEGLIKNRAPNRNAHNGPIFHRAEYVTCDNEFYGVEAGHHCQILWMYNDLNLDWCKALPDETAAMIRSPDHKNLGTFPHFSTFLTQSDRADFLSPESFAEILEGWEEAGLKAAIRRSGHDRMIDLDPSQVALAANHASFNIKAVKAELDALMMF
ncbi:hypothetical protein [Fretibacter rubidus]|uniref:hypothetical protein n=1 Tax=Fretibacter rubidus TaxID=570162 RepID=UPI00352A7A87